MKFLLIPLLFLTLLFAGMASAQSTIWSENFNDPSDDGIGATGISEENPPTITAPSSGKWSVDVSHCKLTATDDYFKVKNQVFAASDIDGTQGSNGTGQGAVWTSEAIDISAYSNVSISLDVGNNKGGFESADFIKASYQIDGGSITTFGHVYDDFSSQAFSASGLEGNLLILFVEVDNNAETEEIYFDNVSVSGSYALPAIYCPVGLLSSMGYVEGSGPGTPASFQFSAENLTQALVVSPTANYEISSDGSSFSTTSIELTPLDGLVSETTCYVRLKAGLASGNYNESVTLSSPGATTQEIECEGSVIPASPVLVINEVDADTYSNDIEEFVELYDGGRGNTPLDGYCVVFYNGGNDLSYSSFDLDTYTTDEAGYFVLGNAAANNVDLIFSNSKLQNGADAVALYQDDASNFPVGTPLSTVNLIDALVYDNGQADDPGLMVLLNEGQAQINENMLGAGPEHSIQRIPNGSGGQRNTAAYYAASPTPGTKNFDAVWMGSTDNDWNTASNWCPQTPPSNGKVYLPAECTNYPQLTNNTALTEMVLEHNARLNGQEYLLASTSLVLLHDITASSDYENLDHWQYFSVPFQGCVSSDLLSDNARIDLWLAEYNNDLNADIDLAWSFISSPVHQLTMGKGYAVTYTYDTSEDGNNVSGNNYKLRLQGTKAELSAPVTIPLAIQQNNYNLVGNPYLASIDWYDYEHINHEIVQGRTAYIFDPSDGTYASVSSDGSGGGNTANGATNTIAPLQGFFVSALSAEDLVIQKNARSNNTSTFFKSETLDAVLSIEVSLDSLSDEMLLVYNNNATPEFDPFDAYKLLSNNTISPQIYSITDNMERLVFNHTNLPNLPVKLEVITNRPGNYQLSIKQSGGIFQQQMVLISDEENNTITLNNENYRFIAPSGKKKHSFMLQFKTTGSGISPELNQPFVYLSGKHLAVKNIEKNSCIEVFSLMGKKLMHIKTSDAESMLELPAFSGWLLVHINNAQQATTHKIFVP